MKHSPSNKTHLEVCNMQVNPRKRGNEATMPGPKRQCRPQSKDGRDELFEPRSSPVEGEEASRASGADEQSSYGNHGLSASEAIPSTTATTSHSLETVPQHAQSTRPVDNTTPEDISNPQKTDTGARENLDSHPGRLPETQKKVMAMTLSRCRVAVYPVQVFPDLIQQASQDIRFRRREPGACNYRSDLIRSGAGQFCILVSQEILDQVGQRCDGEMLVESRSFLMLTTQ
ncbi:hypothetical protein LZ30DRAFT_32102 [Colletotrichum cereale]|nr:hypothetical protein LZ30DRAFT_32102 [Colletotrichum cereale]